METTTRLSCPRPERRRSRSLRFNSKLQSLSKKNEEFSRKLKLIDAINETLSKTVESQEERIERKLDLVNMSNAALSAQVQVMSQRLTTLEKEGTHNISLTALTPLSFPPLFRAYTRCKILHFSHAAKLTSLSKIPDRFIIGILRVMRQ